MTAAEALQLKFYSNDLNKKVTIAEWYKQLFLKLIQEKDNFDSRRPFGNSDWDGDVIACLIRNNVIKGKLDQDHWIEECDWEAADYYFKVMVVCLLNNL